MRPAGLRDLGWQGPYPGLQVHMRPPRGTDLSWPLAVAKILARQFFLFLRALRRYHSSLTC